MQEGINNNPKDSANEKFKYTKIVVVILVLLLIVLGMSYIVTRKSANTSIIINESDEADFDELNIQGTSDEISEIEKDVNLSDFNELDAELQQIQQEIYAQ